MRLSTCCFFALLAAGCASAPPTVRDADWVRVPIPQSEALTSAGDEVRLAREELGRARDGIGEARREEASVEADKRAAQEENARVERLVQAAKARTRAAEARADYVEKLLEARRAAEAAAQARVDLANAKVELLRFQALEQAKAPALSQYDKGAFYEQAAASQRKADEARAEARKRSEEATAARRAWEDRQREVAE